MTKPTHELRHAIQARITELGTTRQWVARKARTFGTNLGEYLNGKREMQTASIERVLKVLHLVVVPSDGPAPKVRKSLRPRKPKPAE